MSQPSPPPGRSARYERSAAGMAGALIVTILAVAAFIGFRALNRDPLEVKPEALDYLSVAAQAQQMGLEPVYPSRLPDGWIATSAAAGRQPGAWTVGILTDADTFVGIDQGGDTLEGLVASDVDQNAVEGDPVTLTTEVASQWRTFSDSGGDHAYAAEVGGQPLLVYGSADDEDLRTLLGLLTTAPLEAPGGPPSDGASASATS